jgi:hypothetical protein
VAYLADFRFEQGQNNYDTNFAFVSLVSFEQARWAECRKEQIAALRDSIGIDGPLRRISDQQPNGFATPSALAASRGGSEIKLNLTARFLGPS